MRLMRAQQGVEDSPTRSLITCRLARASSCRTFRIARSNLSTDILYTASLVGNNSNNSPYCQKIRCLFWNLPCTMPFMSNLTLPPTLPAPARTAASRVAVSGAQSLLDTLVTLGVDTIFGYP